MSSDMSFERYFALVKERWRTFAAVAVGAIVLSAIFSGSYFIEPRFRSSATVYPVNLTSYSIETKTDQLLQLLESNSIRDTVIEKFDLARHYDIDTSEAPGYTYLYNEYEDRIDISKTRYESVQIEVVDEDPERARDMVQEILDQANLLARRLQREKSNELLRITLREVSVEKTKLDSVEALLNVLRKETGLLNYDAQTEEITRGYMRMLSNPGVPAANREEAKEMLRALGEKGGEFRNLSDLSNMFRGNYVARLNEYEKVRIDVAKELTYSNMILYPEVADKKVFPIRWLIVLLTTVSALLLAFVLVVWRDQVRV